MMRKSARQEALEAGGSNYSQGMMSRHRHSNGYHNQSLQSYGRPNTPPVINYPAIYPQQQTHDVTCGFCKHRFYIGKDLKATYSPLLLPCGHPTCSTCESMKPERPCGICHDFPVDVEVRKRLPCNLYVIGLVHAMYSAPLTYDDPDIQFHVPLNAVTRQNFELGSCSECGMVAYYNCQQCGVRYCKLCFKKMHKKALQNHEPVPLNKNAFDCTISTFCPNHEAESTEYYCIDCNFEGCSHCIIKLHSGHYTQSHNDRNKDWIVDFRVAYAKLQETKMRVHQTQQVTHNSGMPLYLHKQSRVCTLSKPYFLGPGSVRKHEVPVSAIPCLQYKRALIEEEKPHMPAVNLWNDTLECYKPFDKDTYNMIMLFIDRLPGVICFVAHNGNRFDYPVFLSEIEKINMTFPDRILCVDTLIAFKEFFSDAQPVNVQCSPAVPPDVDEVDEEELQKLKKQNSNDVSLDDDWNDSLCSVVDELENIRASLSCENGKDVLDAITNKKQADGNSGSTPPTGSPKSMQAINEKTPQGQIIKQSRVTLNSVRKQLNFGDSKPKNYQLATVYQHMVGCEAKNLHSAEGDCISMLTCICKMGPHFAQWADHNAVSLNLFKK